MRREGREGEEMKMRNRRLEIYCKLPKKIVKYVKVSLIKSKYLWCTAVHSSVVTSVFFSSGQ